MLNEIFMDGVQYLHRTIGWGTDLAVQLEVPEMVNAAIFYAIAGVIVLGALGVVLLRNLVHSALCLTVAFIGIGCSYIFLSADFMGAVQIMVYGGAVSILLVMGIMFTRRDDMAHSNPSRGLMPHLMAVPVAGGFLGVMALVALFTPFNMAPPELGDTASGIAELMLTKYALPFEVVAVLLLAALIGAIILAKGVDES